MERESNLRALVVDAQFPAQGGASDRRERGRDRQRDAVPVLAESQGWESTVPQNPGGALCEARVGRLRVVRSRRSRRRLHLCALALREAPERVFSTRGVRDGAGSRTQKKYDFFFNRFHEIVERHVDGSWCERERTRSRICTARYRTVLKGSHERFDAFVREILGGERGGDNSAATLGFENDRMSYHLQTQSAVVGAYAEVGFVGRLERLREDVLALLSSAVHDPEALVRSTPGLGALLGQSAPRAGSARLSSEGSSRAPAPARSRGRPGCLSRKTRRIVAEYYRQDHACFAYVEERAELLEAPAEDPADCDALSWRA